MSIKRFFKKVRQVLIYDYLVICVLSFSIFFGIPVQRSYSQEANKLTETSENLQQQNTLIENHNKRHVIDSPISATSQSIGKIAKKRGLKKAISYNPVIDKSGNIFIASCDGKLSAIDPDGDTKWYVQLADKINTGFAISSDNTLYFSSEKTLYAIGLNGVLKWIFNADNIIDFPSVLDNQGNVYIVTKRDDFLYAIRPDGSLYWNAHINGHISTPPSITMDGRIYVTTQNNILYAINADGSLRWRREIYCRREDRPLSVAEAVNVASSNTTLQSNTKPVQEAREQNTPQVLRISYLKPEEIQASSKETDRPAITSFAASTLQGTPPLSVKFSDASTGKIISRFWDFGDGTLVSAEQVPDHVYTTPGNYDVRLIVNRPDSTSNIIRRSYITVTDTFSNNSKEITTNKQGKNNDMPLALTPISNIHNNAKLSESETLISVANGKDP